jgi:hypothetical protein
MSDTCSNGGTDRLEWNLWPGHAISPSWGTVGDVKSRRSSRVRSNVDADLASAASPMGGQAGRGSS